MSDSLTYRAPVVEGTDGTLADSSRPAARGLFARLRSAVAYLAEMPRRRAVLDELSMLTDRELADIGLSRAELGRVFDPSFGSARR